MSNLHPSDSGINVLGSLVGNANIKIEPPEDPSDRDHRHRMELIKLLFGMTICIIAFLIGVLMTCLSGEERTREVGINIMMMVVGGAVGFTAGKKT